MTAWVRYYAILPFALVFLSTLSAFFIYLSFYISAKAILEDVKSKFLILAAIIGTLFFHFILLQAKITHFYELYFGFALFTLAISFLLELFIKGKITSTKRWWLISLLILFNPGIHYHFLFLFILIIFFVYFSIINIRNKDYLNFIIKQSGLIIFISTLPYVLLIWYVTKHSGDFRDSIPLAYTTILYSSVPISNLLSFDIASQYEMFAKGSYLVLIPGILEDVLSCYAIIMSIRFLYVVP